MNRSYYTLAFFSGDRWIPEFGDYQRSVVQDELDDYLEGGAKKKHFCILTSGDSQAEINAELARINRLCAKV